MKNPRKNLKQINKDNIEKAILLVFSLKFKQIWFSVKEIKLNLKLPFFISYPTLYKYLERLRKNGILDRRFNEEKGRAIREYKKL